MISKVATFSSKKVFLNQDSSLNITKIPERAVTLRDKKRSD